MDQLREFIESLLKDQGVVDIDPEVKEELVRDLTDRLTDLINRRVVEAIPDDKLTQFNELLDEEPLDNQKMQKFIEDNVEDREKIATATMLEFRALYLGAKA